MVNVMAPTVSACSEAKNKSLKMKTKIHEIFYENLTVKLIFDVTLLLKLT
jgi:hypothetical protein